VPRVWGISCGRLRQPGDIELTWCGVCATFHLPGMHDQKTHGNRRPSARVFDTSEATQSWGNDNFREWSADLAPEELKSFRDYAATGDFVDINGSLRQGTSPSPKIQGDIDNMSTALERSSMPERTTVYRTMPDFVVADTEPGSVIQDSGFASATLFKRDRDIGEGLVDVEIVVPKGAKAAYIQSEIGDRSARVTNTGFHEVLMQRDTKFRILDKRGGKVRMEIVE